VRRCVMLRVTSVQIAADRGVECAPGATDNVWLGEDYARSIAPLGGWTATCPDGPRPVSIQRA
jgi:hypothetical protein